MAATAALAAGLFLLPWSAPVVQLSASDQSLLYPAVQQPQPSVEMPVDKSVGSATSPVLASWPPGGGTNAVLLDLFTEVTGLAGVGVLANDVWPIVEYAGAHPTLLPEVRDCLGWISSVMPGVAVHLSLAIEADPEIDERRPVLNVRAKEYPEQFMALIHSVNASNREVRPSAPELLVSTDFAPLEA